MRGTSIAGIIDSVCCCRVSETQSKMESQVEEVSEENDRLNARIDEMNQIAYQRTQAHERELEEARVQENERARALDSAVQRQKEVFHALESSMERGREMAAVLEGARQREEASAQETQIACGRVDVLQGQCEELKTACCQASHKLEECERERESVYEGMRGHVCAVREGILGKATQILSSKRRWGTLRDCFALWEDMCISFKAMVKNGDGPKTSESSLASAHETLDSGSETVSVFPWKDCHAASSQLLSSDSAWPCDAVREVDDEGVGEMLPVGCWGHAGKEGFDTSPCGSETFRNGDDKEAGSSANSTRGDESADNGTEEAKVLVREPQARGVIQDTEAKEQDTFEMEPEGVESKAEEVASERNERDIETRETFQGGLEAVPSAHQSAPQDPSEVPAEFSETVTFIPEQKDARPVSARLGKCVFGVWRAAVQKGVRERRVVARWDARKKFQRM